VNSYNEDKINWKVTLVDTGQESMTGGRVKRMQSFIGDKSFLLTYGDGVADVNIAELVAYHKSHGKYATVTSIQPAGRFGSLDLDSNNLVHGFKEKPKGDGAWINGGFFVFEPEMLNYIAGDSTILEKEPLEVLAREKQLVAHKHSGFWQPMDTLRDKTLLEDLWKTGDAPWKVW
jgi:glucose-1-phosphate cytidylyltransferase